MNAIRDHISFQSETLSLRDARNTMLASNIANAATPGYKARDLDFDRQMAAKIGDSPVRKGDARHVDNLVSVGADRVQYRKPLNPSLDGNTVEMSVEQMEFSENSLRYMTTLTFLNNRISGLMTAIRGE
ncbi:flagellar basal body rod protein FlgB [Planktotalea arctica]|uniref:flagellar basal body rod protein FlgB n=1 Tax=Planktotalea arctica TaxID=1481893 RepID=UPI000A177550|nr:flagellar basal body rod protein FlgB [Planktotalea arctica]